MSAQPTVRAARSPEQSLLIVTDRNDFAADFLIVRLRERGLPYFRLNSDELAETAITFKAGAGEKGQRSISCGGVPLDLDEVQSVWYRRAIRPSAHHSVDPDYRSFAASELRHVFEGLIADPKVRWVNPPAATEVAERKVYQLRIAERHGLRIPPTIISTESDELAHFARSHERVICKTISQGLVKVRGDAFAIHTHVVSHQEIADSSEAGGAPIFLQRSIPKGTDIRVTIIGEAIFAAEIIVPDDAPIDWRATREHITYRPGIVPAEVERASRSLMAELGICYGAFDFIRTDCSEWYFLEVNPAGEWAWLDVELGLSMRDELIDLLYDKH